MTLLQILQEFCIRTGLVKPLIVMQSQDDQLLQLTGLANEVITDLVRRRAWTELQTESTFTSIAGGDQGAVDTLAPAGLLKILNETIYDRTRRLPVFGPRSPQAWQAIKAMPMAGPYYQYRIRGGRLLITPDMPAGHTMAFEYASKSAILAADGTTLKEYFTADDDSFLLDSALLQLGLRWRWKEEKGLPYMESYRLFEAAVSEAMGADGTKPVLSMADSFPLVTPGVFIPSGNWSV